MSITLHEIAKMLDHSTLQPFLTPEDIRKGCDIALEYGTATVCARPYDMPLVVKRLRGSDVLPCTVIGFPHGAHHTSVKVFEAERALDDGCRELDMVLNIGEMLAGNEHYVRDEIAKLAQAAHARKALLKVILETCYLSDAQKRLACRQAGASRCGVSATQKIMEEARARQAQGALTEQPLAAPEEKGGAY